MRKLERIAGGLNKYNDFFTNMVNENPFFFKN